MSGLATSERLGPVWLDGTMVAPERATLPVLSFGLHNAACVIEGVRVYDGRPFALTEHLDRFALSADLLGMPLPFTPDTLRDAVAATVSAAGFPDAYVRPVAWRGDEAIGIDPGGSTVHVAVAVLDWAGATATRPHPRLALSRWARPAPHMAQVRAKAAMNYVIGGLAVTEAVRAGFDDALLLDHQGYVAEATGANVFLVRDGRLVTPTADTFLDGITRRTILRLAEPAGIPVTVGRVSVADVRAADEVFLTGTAGEVQPVAGFQDVAFRTDGPITSWLAAAYARLVRQPSAAGAAP